MNLFRTPLGGFHLYGVFLVVCLCTNGIDSHGPYQGCYKDATQRVMQANTALHRQNSMTINLCDRHCRDTTTYTFIGLEYSYVCYCGDTYARYGIAPDDCTYPCSGNASQICGAGYRLSVYAVCPSGQWGQECEEQCHCSGQEVCSRQSGTCVSGCLPGWLGTSCSQPDCSIQNGNCSQVCDQDEDSVRCLCHQGYALDSDGRTCSDVDECTTRSHQCSAGDNFCRNTIGSYTCDCPDGYQVKDGDLHHCTDVDECTTRIHQCSAGHNFCRNTIGSYTCFCPDGYQVTDGDLHTCSDVDECNSGAHRCSAGDDLCQNTNGKYSCSCPDGYQFEGGDVHYCSDIDECSTSTHLCQAACTNIPGSYTCTCQGFTDDNDECKETCAFDFQLKLPKEGGVSSDCHTLDIIYNVTLQYSQRLACNVSGNVINVLSNVHVIKKCLEGDL